MYKKKLQYVFMVIWFFVIPGFCNIANSDSGNASTDVVEQDNLPAVVTHDKPLPNIIFIMADDLGYGELGCYGQTKITTPNLDSLAARGMRFTQFYSGSPVCAPSRCTLLTGKHTGHAFVRDNYELGGWGPDEPEGQLGLADDEITIAEVLKTRGYTTGVIGKWGLGGPDSEGHPNNQGFDHWYGYLCQRVAHNYYPTHLWRNDEKVMLEGNEYFRAHQRLEKEPREKSVYKNFSGKQYAPDLMIEEALAFIKDNMDSPFFLYYATPVPHAALQVPEDSLQPYLKYGWDAGQPYLGNKGYLPQERPRSAYAAMVSRMDGDIGKMVTLLEDLGLSENTIIFFTSDNGPTFNGGTDSLFFNSAGEFRGLKCSVYEGGIRVPLIVYWPGMIDAGVVSEHISALWDVLPTITELAGIDNNDDIIPDDIDGISFLPTLLVNAGEEQIQKQNQHEYIYWEYGGWQAVRMGDWKAVRRRGKGNIELYNLVEDIGEQIDVADENPEITIKMLGIMITGRTDSEYFPLMGTRK